MDIYVSTTGSDTTGDGSQSNPYRHIQKAFDNLNSGDTIILMSGTYQNEPSFTNPGSRDFTIKAQQGLGSVTIELNPDVLSQQSGIYYLFKLNTTGSGGREGVCEDIIFKIIDSSSSYSNLELAIAINSYDDFKFVKCVFYSELEHNSSYKLYGWYEPSTYGQELRWYKCSFINLSKGIYKIDGTLYLHLVDSLFTDCNSAVEVKGLNKQEESNNCFYNNNNNILVNGTSQSLDSTDITSDPNLYDVYKIMDTSPCANSGIVVTDYVEEYEGAAPDIGAYETTGYIIKGKVTLNGSPIQGAIVRLFNITDKIYEGSVTTNSNGDYEFNVVSTKKYHVFVEYTDPTTGDKFNALSKWDISPVSSV